MVDEDDGLESVVVGLAVAGKFDHVGLMASAKYAAAGVPLTIRRDDLIIRIYPDGREEVLERLPKLTYRLPAGVRVLDDA